MAEETLPPEIEKALAAEAGVSRPITEDYQPQYRMIGSAKIPVSKAHGKIWEGRRKAAERALVDYRAAWEEAERYYNNDQSSHRREGNETGSGNDTVARRINSRNSATENVVFANVSAMLPALYAKNPRGEFTANNETMRPLAMLSEKLINKLVSMKAAPGLNLKPKARKGIVQALLTNSSYLEIGWTFKDMSNEETTKELERVAKELAEAKTPKDIERLEGELLALEDAMDILRPAGPYIRLRRAIDVLVDPDSSENDHSDANWMMIRDYLPTKYLNARYGKKSDGDDGKTMSVYEPTHVLLAAAESSIDDEVANFSLFEKSKEHNAYGYDNNEAYSAAQRTEVWFVWDKVTRRLLMYHTKDWTWPIWVWDDPYKLDTFFPAFRLTLHENPKGSYAKGEVSYYLDQQDAINEINSERRTARLWAKRNLFYDKNRITNADVEQVLKGPDGTARGLDVPEGMKLTDLIFSIVPPSMNFPQLFNVDQEMAAISRISSVSDIMRGAQFKTNTTNKAIENYNSVTNMRIDERTDAVEDWIGSVLWGITQLCYQFMDATTVQSITGEDTTAWRQLTPDEIRSVGSMRVVGGSTSKPTSATKKQEALELGQVLGQFVNAAPQAVISILLKVFEQAFDEINMAEQDWKMLQNSILQQGQQPPQDGGSIEQEVAQFPPEVQQAFKTSVAKGVPPEEALRILKEKLSQPQPSGS